MAWLWDLGEFNSYLFLTGWEFTPFWTFQGGMKISYCNFIMWYMFKAQVKVLVNVLNSDLVTFWGITKKGYLITLLSLKKDKNLCHGCDLLLFT